MVKFALYTFYSVVLLPHEHDNAFINFGTGGLTNRYEIIININAVIVTFEKFYLIN